MASQTDVEASLSESVLNTARASRNLSNYRALVNRVSDVFGDEVKASLWLSHPNADLGGETPLQFAMKDCYEAQTLEPILARMEHGIPA